MKDSSIQMCLQCIFRRAWVYSVTRIGNNLMYFQVSSRTQLGVCRRCPISYVLPTAHSGIMVTSVRDSHCQCLGMCVSCHRSLLCQQLGRIVVRDCMYVYMYVRVCIHAACECDCVHVRMRVHMHGCM